MAAPAFLSSSFAYFERQGVSDVQTIMDDIDHQVKNHTTPAWTNPSAGLYKSPVDAVGRFFDVLLTRVTQQKLEWRVRDSDFGRRFGHPDNPHLPAADLELCAAADRFEFAMPMRHVGDRLVIEAAPLARHGA